MYRYDNYTDSFIRIDGEPNTGTTTVRAGVPLKESVIVQKTELTDECIDRIADAVVLKLADRKTEPQIDCEECKYVWWNSEAKRYECQIEKCPYSRKTENSSEKPNNSTISKMEQVGKE